MTELSAFLNASLDTPAFVYDDATILRNLRTVRTAATKASCRFLYSIKSFSHEAVLRLMLPHVDGFAVSSLFEAMLCREVIGSTEGRSVHITTPSYRPGDLVAILEHVDHLNFNSLSQLRRWGEVVSQSVSCGLRVNPQLSFIEDERYNPCRAGSKLGVGVEELGRLWKARARLFQPLSGLQLHSNCGSADFGQLLAIVNKVLGELRPYLRQLRWVNVGGGYLFGPGDGAASFQEAVRLLQAEGVEVVMEPGEAIVWNAGFLVSRVVDLHRSGGRTVAILDTSVNHLPEYFEYQMSPTLLNHDPAGSHTYILAGATCLAGDLFGEYRFRDRLRVGDVMAFAEVGAYTLVKAHMFNGIPLPSLYRRLPNGEFRLERRVSYDDFARHWKASADLGGAVLPSSRRVKAGVAPAPVAGAGARRAAGG